MSNLVVLKRQQNEDIPVTTSKVIAEGTNIEHRSIYLLLEKYINDFKELGRVSFEMTPIETKGGKQDTKIYYLNEDQALLLITYLRNNEVVRKLKIALIKEFSAMKKIISMRQNEQWKQIRLETKKTRIDLSDAIKALPESPHKRYKYNQYTDLIYKIIFDKNSKQLREQYGIAKGKSVRDFFTPDELNHVTKLELQVATLIDLGLEYKTIQETLIKKYSISKVLSFQCSTTPPP